MAMLECIPCWLQFNELLAPWQVLKSISVQNLHLILWSYTFPIVLDIHPCTAPMDVRKPEATGALTEKEILILWNLFVAIHDEWGSDECRVQDMASRWREFVSVKTEEVPSYLTEYRFACSLIKDLLNALGDQAYRHIFFEIKSSEDSPAARLKHFVVDEFIRVYISSGGFKCFGGANYGGFVSGSRYRTIPPYRTYEDSQ